MTPQYKGLQGLYEKYKEQGLEVLGFPCNQVRLPFAPCTFALLCLTYELSQFGSQEPATDSEISQFCELNHGVTFPLMKKSDVNGDDANEVFKYLKNEKKGLLGLSRIKWNFEKFLVDRNGAVVGRFVSTTTPEALDPEIQKLL